MVEVALGSPCHASSHDRPPGHLGGPLAPGGTCPGPDHCGLSAAHWDLHPDGCSSRGYNSAHQTGECRCVSNGTNQNVNNTARLLNLLCPEILHCSAFLSTGCSVNRS